MGYGLSREDIMTMAFKIVERTGRQHPFQDGVAGRGWYDGFMARHSNLTLRTAQPLKPNIHYRQLVATKVASNILLVVN